MTRVLILGNSHVAALKLGWESLAKNHSDVDVQFFAAPCAMFRRIKLDKKGVLGLSAAHRNDQHSIKTLEKLNGTLSVTPGDYDAVIWAGHAWYRHIVPSFLREFSIDGVRETDAMHRMSETAYKNMCMSLSERFAPGGRWKRYCRDKLWIAPHPIQSESIIKSTDAEMERWRQAGAQGKGFRQALDIYFSQFENMLTNRNIGYIGQPEETLSDTGLSKEAFSSGSTRLKGGDKHGDEDYSHMNRDFGEIMIRLIMEKIRKPHTETPETGR
ncbi:hypothetical protein [Amaricoccus tamworthensis]|uniref:hypothetical protein n=1 Tax=Amaricoccus tamworthensis TaxID=57002 RepID=UPI003C7CF98F